MIIISNKLICLHSIKTQYKVSQIFGPTVFLFVEDGGNLKITFNGQ